MAHPAIRAAAHRALETRERLIRQVVKSKSMTTGETGLNRAHSERREVSLISLKNRDSSFHFAPFRMTDMVYVGACAPPGGEGWVKWGVCERHHIHKIRD